MSHEKSRSRPRRSCIESEEDRAWVGFYQRVGRDPTVANEIMIQLESDPEKKRSHLALYLCCKESLRQHRARQKRNERIGRFVRWLCDGLFVRPLRGLQNGLRHGSDIAVECLPDIAREPAVAQMRRLTRESEFSTARAAFEQQAARQAACPVAASSEIQAPPSAKTARAVA